MVQLLTKDGYNVQLKHDQEKKYFVKVLAEDGTVLASDDSLQSNSRYGDWDSLYPQWLVKVNEHYGQKKEVKE